MKKLLFTLLALAALVGLLGAGTLAYFSDTETSSANTFAAGTLNMVLSGGTQNNESVIGTWVSPANWAPGQSVYATLHFTNKGSIDAHHIYFRFFDRANNGAGDSSNLMSKIIVEELKERFNSVTTGNQAANIDAQVGNHDGVLTLKEFTDFNYNNIAYYTVDDQSGDGVVLGAGDKGDYDLILKLTFDSSAGNEYQGDTCQFSLEVKATQDSPTEGLVKLHQ